MNPQERDEIRHQRYIGFDVAYANGRHARDLRIEQVDRQRQPLEERIPGAAQIQTVIGIGFREPGEMHSVQFMVASGLGNLSRERANSEQFVFSRSP